MGVPVVVLRGKRHVGRVGASLLTRVGLDELIAETPRGYVEKSVSLAEDKEKLTILHNELRSRMRNSALGDANRFARTLEKAFREMWLKWLRVTNE
jgi:predicted O-linked N-acetylglucosamine transferase (SPINDLY family)